MSGGNEYDKCKSMCEFTMGRSLGGSVCGIAAIILAILGLVHFMPMVMVCVATIVLGGAFLFRGIMIACEYTRLLVYLSGNASEKLELSGGTSIEILVGIAGMVLGILALLTADPAVLVSIAVIVFGVGMVMGASVVARLNALKMECVGTECAAQQHKLNKVTHEIIGSTLGTQFLSGLTAIVLGILALISFVPILLTLVAILVLGGAMVLSGSAITGRMSGMMKT